MTAEGDKTLHQRIVSDIEGQIVSGAWPPGHRIPFELDLAGQYGCSRMTVNKALTQLANAGLIERRRKAGSYVAQPRAQSAVLDIHDIRDEVQSLGLPYGYGLIGQSRHKLKKGEGERLALEPGTPVLSVSACHSAGARPFCFEDRLINLAVVPEAAEADFTAIASGPWLVDRVPWSAAEHAIHAVGADEKVASALKILPGAPCLVVERRTWSGAVPITHVRLIYPGDRHSLVARFAPTDPGERVATV